MLLSTCPPFPLLQTTTTLPSPVTQPHQLQSPHKKKKGGGDGDRDWLEVTVGREMQDLSV